MSVYDEEQQAPSAGRQIASAAGQHLHQRHQQRHDQRQQERRQRQQEQAQERAQNQHKRADAGAENLHKRKPSKRADHAAKKNDKHAGKFIGGASGGAGVAGAAGAAGGLAGIKDNIPTSTADVAKKLGKRVGLKLNNKATQMWAKVVDVKIKIGLIVLAAKPALIILAIVIMIPILTGIIGTVGAIFGAATSSASAGVVAQCGGEANGNDFVGGKDKINVWFPKQAPPYSADDWVKQWQKDPVNGPGQPNPDQKQVMKAAEAALGVPWYLLAAIAWQETKYGTEDGVPNDQNVGLMQLSPDVVKDFGTDGDGDNNADINNWKDQVFTAAKFLVNYGVLKPPDGVQKALGGHYNNGLPNYASSVILAANLIRGGSSQGEKETESEKPSETEELESETESYTETEPEPTSEIAEGDEAKPMDYNKTPASAFGDIRTHFPKDHGPYEQRWANDGTKPGPPPKEILDKMKEIGRITGVPYYLLAGHGWMETRFSTGVNKSSTGAKGIMQFMPATWTTIKNKYGLKLDGNADGEVADSAGQADWEDVVYAAAYLTLDNLALAQGGSYARGSPRLAPINGKDATSVGNKIWEAIFWYNHDQGYVNSVLKAANYYRTKYGETADLAACPGDAAAVGMGDTANGQQLEEPTKAQKEKKLPADTVTKGETKRNLGVRAAVKKAFPKYNGEMQGRRQGDPLDHGQGKATDFMITVPARCTNPAASEVAEGFKIANWAVNHASQLGIKYVIYRQKIWDIRQPEAGWKTMEDRGTCTANHMDHVHISVF